MTKMAYRVIVDTFALIAILRREPDADQLTDAFLAAPEPKMSAGTLLETRIIAQRDNGVAELEALIDSSAMYSLTRWLALWANPPLYKGENF